MTEEIDLSKKWVLAFDTWCDGQQCDTTDEAEEDEQVPLLYDSEQEVLDQIADNWNDRVEGGCVTKDEQTEEYPVRADRYIHGRKAIFTGSGGYIEGNKLDMHKNLKGG
jgi:hypothetical protein